eukprot:COSAG01_NODE_32407_length_582_cov_0.536232_2_plen_69_part_01
MHDFVLTSSAQLVKVCCRAAGNWSFTAVALNRSLHGHFPSPGAQLATVPCFSKHALPPPLAALITVKFF